MRLSFRTCMKIHSMFLTKDNYGAADIRTCRVVYSTSYCRSHYNGFHLRCIRSYTYPF